MNDHRHTYFRHTGDNQDIDICVQCKKSRDQIEKDMYDHVELVHMLARLAFRPQGVLLPTKFTFTQIAEVISYALKEIEPLSKVKIALDGVEHRLTILKCRLDD